MRVAVIGQGSIGRRHAQLLLDAGHEVVAFDPDASQQVQPEVDRVDALDEALDRADAAVIASRSSEHARQARRAVERSIPTLVEKPLATNAAVAMELECLAAQRGVLLAVAMNLRHHPGVAALAQMLRDGSVSGVLRASAWCGSWLPGWRPGTDYRASYSARSDLGGGVLLDVAIHEVDYVLWLLGPAKAVSSVTRRVSPLDLDVEDVAVITLELTSGAVADIVVDYFDRAYHRGCRIVGQSGTLHWSWEDQRLSWTKADGERSDRVVASDVGPSYRSQLEQFVAVVRGGSGLVVPPGDALGVLAVIDAARSSSRDGRRVNLPAPIALRPVRPEDSEAILDWRNDPETRRWSRSTAEISSQEHARWFDRVLADPTNTMWIGEAESVPVGQIRVTRDGAGSAELHVTTAPRARGKRLGTALIMDAAARVLAEPDIGMLVAHVKPANEASRRAFTSAGFAPAGRNGEGLERLERKACG